MLVTRLLVEYNLLFDELVMFSIDGFHRGNVSRIGVTIENDGSFSVNDDGPGISTDIEEKWSQELGRPISRLEAVMTVMRYALPDRCKQFAGLRGVGITVVNALSEWCEVEVSNGRQSFRQRYEKAAAVAIEVEPCRFEGATKTKLANPEVESILDAVTYEFVTEFLNKNPFEARRLIAQAVDRAASV